jgi:hypothetical protein
MPRPRPVTSKTVRARIKLMAFKLHKQAIISLQSNRMERKVYEWSDGSWNLTIYPVRHKRRIMIEGVDVHGEVKGATLYVNKGRLKVDKMSLEEMKEIAIELGYLLDNTEKMVEDFMEARGYEKVLEQTV